MTLPRASRSTPTRPTEDLLLGCRSAIRHRTRSPVPRILQGRHADDRQLRAARPAPRLHLHRRTRSPATATASSSPPTASAPTSSCLARSIPTRKPASSTISFQNLPQIPSRLQPAFLRLRTRTARDPDPVRHLPGQQHLHALGLRLFPTRPRPSSSRSTRAPTAAPARARQRPFDPSFASRRRRQPPPAPTRPSPSNSPAPTATRT